MAEAIRKLGKNVGVSLNRSIPLPKDSTKHSAKQLDHPIAGEGTFLPRAPSKMQTAKSLPSSKEDMVHGAHEEASKEEEDSACVLRAFEFLPSGHKGQIISSSNDPSIQNQVSSLDNGKCVRTCSVEGEIDYLNCSHCELKAKIL